MLGTQVLRTVPSITRISCRRGIARNAVDSEKVLSQVQGIVAEQLGLEDRQVLELIYIENKRDVMPLSKFTDMDADSLDTVEIMTRLEAGFDIEIDDDSAEQVATVQDAANLIISQLNARSGRS